MIIIFLSLISYNMYKVYQIDKIQGYTLQNIKNTKNERFSQSIIMQNMERIFFRFNYHLINNIFRKICKDARSNNNKFYIRCKEESTDEPEPENDREFDEATLEKFKNKVHDIWKIIITTIEKIEKPFYDYYDDNVIDDMIKNMLDLDWLIEAENLRLFNKRRDSIIRDSYMKIYNLYMQIIADMINYVIDDKELKQVLFSKFSYLIESIIIKFISNNINDIKKVINTDNEDTIKNILSTKYTTASDMFQNINVQNEIQNSVNRYSNTPNFKNKYDDASSTAKKIMEIGLEQQVEVENFNKLFNKHT